MVFHSRWYGEATSNMGDAAAMSRSSRAHAANISVNATLSTNHSVHWDFSAAHNG